GDRPWPPGREPVATLRRGDHRAPADPGRPHLRLRRPRRRPPRVRTVDHRRAPAAAGDADAAGRRRLHGERLAAHEAPRPPRPPPHARRRRADCEGHSLVNVALLGPQRFKPTLARALQGIDGPIAVVTAGWQERETDDAELDRELGGRSVNLRLHGRAEEIFAADAELKEAHRLRQERLLQLQDFYRPRLARLLHGRRAWG